MWPITAAFRQQASVSDNSSVQSRLISVIFHKIAMPQMCLEGFCFSFACNVLFFNPTDVLFDKVLIV